jgi:glutamate synthase domain-containing protein 3
MVSVKQFDLSELSVREVNQFLHTELSGCGFDRIEIQNPNGLHSIAAGLDEDISVDIRGHAGYYVGGMNQRAQLTIHGNVGWGVGENIMSGCIRVKGHASQCAGATGQGGLLVIEGDASARCGISMKGCDIVVGGNVGHFSAFMAQAGTLVVCGNAGANLGDSLYETTIYVRGSIHSLGADAREEEMQPTDVEQLASLLSTASVDIDPSEFKRVASARTLYHWNTEAHQEY